MKQGQVLFDSYVKGGSRARSGLANTSTKEETGKIENDYVLALIGGAPPTKFLESIGITIPKTSSHLLFDVTVSARLWSFQSRIYLHRAS